MATITGTGQGTEGDDIVEGTSVVIEPSTIQRVLLYLHSFEEVMAFAGQEPGGPPIVEDPEAPPGDEDPTPPPTFTEYVVNEDAGGVEMTFVRENPRPGKSVQISIVAVPGTALQNQHYLNPTSPLTFGDGETLIQSTLTILDANIGIGASRTFKVRLNAAASRREYIRGSISEATVTINGV